MPKKRPANSTVRCAWAGTGPNADPLYHDYHDREWGVPLHDERRLFEMLILEGAQAGLSWITVLKKRENYRRAFANFDVARVARFGKREVKRLLADEGIIRNRLKINAAITNAQSTLALYGEGGSLDEFFWNFVDGAPQQNRWRKLADLPAETDVSRAMSKELRRRGFKFVGPTICYALMQSIGMVNDHTTDCFRYTPVKRLADSSRR